MSTQPVGTIPAGALSKILDTLEDYAMTHTYTGPSVGGTMYAGWPVVELINMHVPPASRAIVHNVFIKRQTLQAGYPLSGASGGGGAGSSVISTPKYSMHDMLCMRMHWYQWGTGFEYVETHKAGETVYVWVILKNLTCAVLEDDAALYPSDALVTKLRLLQQE